MTTVTLNAHVAEFVKGLSLAWSDIGFYGRSVRRTKNRCHIIFKCQIIIAASSIFAKQPSSFACHQISMLNCQNPNDLSGHRAFNHTANLQVDEPWPRYNDAVVAAIGKLARYLLYRSRTDLRIKASGFSLHGGKQSKANQNGGDQRCFLDHGIRLHSQRPTLNQYVRVA
jgi:hypothetical protein